MIIILILFFTSIIFYSSTSIIFYSSTSIILSYELEGVLQAPTAFTQVGTPFSLS
jgi:hypothetical protein